DDGILDLIDVANNLGDLASGGPQITTGPGGDVRYIRVGGEVFRDIFFNSSQPQDLVTVPGEATTVTDDSGAKITLRATGATAPNPDFDPNTVEQIGLNERL